jgi:hypothetical protein
LGQLTWIRADFGFGAAAAAYFCARTLMSRLCVTAIQGMQSGELVPGCFLNRNQSRCADAHCKDGKSLIHLPEIELQPSPPKKLVDKRVGAILFS